MLAVALICLVLAVGLTVSFVGNRGLQADAAAAAKQLQAVQAAPGQLPSADDLKRLDTLRQVLDMLGQYRKDGVPWSLRWGLYTGDAIYPAVRKIYFAHFQQMMFGDSQQALLAHLQRLPARPAATDNYGFTYDTLKAYLITTSNHDKSTKTFLAAGADGALAGGTRTGCGTDGAGAHTIRVLCRRTRGGKPLLDGERESNGRARAQLSFKVRRRRAHLPLDAGRGGSSESVD